VSPAACITPAKITALKGAISLGFNTRQWQRNNQAAIDVELAVVSRGDVLAHGDSPCGEHTLAKCVQLLGQDLKDACTQDYFE
jgi:hypothetical protein